tara:strand:+ start:537 stop:1430 length:894 start_codon:yes stop_codon:yes gene_type:complete
MPDGRHTNGQKEKEQIEAIIQHINNKTPSGKKIIECFFNIFSLTIISARDRTGGNRGTHYDFEILTEENPGKWFCVEAKASKDKKGISEKPWEFGVQFLNGKPQDYICCDIYARLWYKEWIESGLFTSMFDITESIPSYEEWRDKDAFCQSDPKTPYGKQLKSNFRDSWGPKSSMKDIGDGLDPRYHIFEKFHMNSDELNTLKKQIHERANEALRVKDYWVALAGDVTSPETFNCMWYSNFTISTIESIAINKKRSKPTDVIFVVSAKDTNEQPFNFHTRMRWGKGVGFSNLRMDMK